MRREKMPRELSSDSEESADPVLQYRARAMAALTKHSAAGLLQAAVGVTLCLLLAISSFYCGRLSAAAAAAAPPAAPRQPAGVASAGLATAPPPAPAPAADDVLLLPRDLVMFREQGACNATVPPERVGALVLEKLFGGASPYDGFPPPGIGALLKRGRVKGWGSYDPVFTLLIRETRARVVVEIGTFLGASAIHMAAVARDAGLEPIILCVDDFRGWPGARSMRSLRDIPQPNGQSLLLYQFMQNVLRAGFEAAVLPVPFSTTHALTALCDWGVAADLIEVDAGHDFHSAWADINAAFSLLAPEGVMFGHDYYNGADRFGVARAVNLFARLHGFRVEPNHQHWVLRR